jgi:hypothetical protein
MNRQIIHLNIGGVLLLLAFAGCTPQMSIQTPTLTSIPLTTTSISPTVTNEPPTITPAPSITPTATYPPEIVASKPEEIAGLWLVKHFVGQGGQVIFPADLTFRQDGTFSFDEIGDDPMHIFGGTFSFTDGQVTLDSDECYNEAKALFYHCTITFTAFSTLLAGKPVRLRLVSDQKTGVFIVNVSGKNLMLDEP